MSTNLEVLTHLKSTLVTAFAKLAITDQPAAQRVQRLIVSGNASAENASDGYLAQIAPLFGTPKFLLAVQSLNSAVVSGVANVADFDSYVALLATSIRS